MKTIAREIDLADAVTRLIQTSWNPTGDDGVRRVWVADVGLNPDDPKTLVKGTQIYVLPVSHATPEWWTRAVKRNQYTIGVLLVSRYVGPFTTPPNDFVDGLVLLGEQQLFYPLSNPSLVLKGEVITRAYPSREVMPTIDVLVDRERFIENQAVFIQYTFAFEDATDYTGASSP